MIHRLLEPVAGDETLCRISIIMECGEDGLVRRFLSARTKKPISCVWTARDVTCNTCQHVQRKIGAAS